MPYATSTKRKPQTKTPSWAWEIELRVADESRQREVSGAARRFRKTISQ